MPALVPIMRYTIHYMYSNGYEGHGGPMSYAVARSYLDDLLSRHTTMEHWIESE